MKKLTAIMAVFSALLLSSLVVNSYAAAPAPMTKSWVGYDMADFIGISVRNSNGYLLGTINDFLFDHNGQVAFAILNFPTEGEQGSLTNEEGVTFEKKIAVPYGALSLSPADTRSGKQYFVLNTTTDSLLSAPSYDKSDLEASVGQVWLDIYRYFGVRPYWTEEGEGASMMNSSPGNNGIITNPPENANIDDEG